MQDRSKMTPGELIHLGLQQQADALKPRAAAPQLSARENFIATALHGLPQTYSSQLGPNPDNWPYEAKTIRAQWEADLANFPAPAEPAAKPDLSTMTTQEKIRLGLRQQVSQQGQANPNALPA
jgi:hypothetical protein